MLLLAILLIVLGNLGDWYSTNRALQNPKNRETNPVIRKFGIAPVKVLGVVLQTWCVVMVRDLPLVMFAIAGASFAFYAWVTVHNLRLK